LAEAGVCGKIFVVGVDGMIIIAAGLSVRIFAVKAYFFILDDQILYTNHKQTIQN